MPSLAKLSRRTISSNTLAGLSEGVVHRDDSSLPIFSSETLRGGVFLMSRYGLGVLVSLGNMLVMTRWIGPHSYGLFVTAIGLVGFLSTLARAGVDVYLVRRETLPDERMYHVAGTLIFSISVGLTLIGGALAPLLIRWYGNSEFLSAYVVLLLTVPLIGLTGVPMAKLERDLNFRSVAGIELGGQVLGLLLAVFLAAGGAGVWAPVAGQMASQTVTLVAACTCSGFLPHFRFNRGQAREMLTFGIGQVTSSRVWQLRTLVNPLLVGRVAGAEGVAYVAFGIRIAEALGAVRLAAGRLALAALSRLQDKPETFRTALQRTLELQVIMLGPLLCGFALIGPLVLQHVIGTRWMPSLLVYPFVAAGVLINSVFNLQASALFVAGRHWVVLRSYSMHVALLGGGTLLLVPHFGITGYGWSELFACAAYVLIYASTARIAVLSYRKLLFWMIIFLSLLFAPSLGHGRLMWLWLLLPTGAVGWQFTQTMSRAQLRNTWRSALRNTA
jgi:O-antigen/teichoic acid export membrane protein